MALERTDDLPAADRRTLPELYRLGPAGDKHAGRLRTCFGNSALRCFAQERGPLAGAARVPAARGPRTFG